MPSFVSTDEDWMLPYLSRLFTEFLLQRWVVMATDTYSGEIDIYLADGTYQHNICCDYMELFGCVIVEAHLTFITNKLAQVSRYQCNRSNSNVSTMNHSY
ncbi:hypothetical protein PS15m_000167 [Mucor circinelloides]